jgi:hypothetical protein
MKRACPACGSVDIVRIVYGFPSPDILADAEAGKIHVGGCVVGSNRRDAPRFDRARNAGTTGHSSEEWTTAGRSNRGAFVQSLPGTRTGPPSNAMVESFNVAQSPMA